MATSIGSPNNGIQSVFIVRDKDTILCSYQSAKEGISVPHILEVVRCVNTSVRETCLLDRLHFHSIGIDSVLLICVADATFPSRIAFKFLGELQEDLYQKVREEEIEGSIAHGLDSRMKSILKSKVDHYNSLDSDSLRKAQAAVRETKQVMTKNIEQLLNNQIKIEILQDKSEALKQNAILLNKQAAQVKCYHLTRNVKIIIGVILFVIVVAFILFAAICKFDVTCGL